MNSDATTSVGRPMTYGEKAVGLSFNPSGDTRVNDIKVTNAAMIDMLHAELDKEFVMAITGAPNVVTERGEIIIEAIRQIQTAQMWAVKAITWKN